MKLKESLKGIIIIIICILIFICVIFFYNKYKNVENQEKEQKPLVYSEELLEDFENLEKKEISETIPPEEMKNKYIAQIEISKKAIEDNKPSQERFQDLSEDYLIISWNYQVLGQYKEAENWYEQLLEKWSNNYRAIVNLGDLYILMNQYKESAKYFYMAIDMYPETDIAYIKLSDLYTKYAKNNKDKASQIYEEGINKANYKKTILKAYAGYLELYKKDYEKAISIWREYEKVSGDKAEQEILKLQQSIDLK